MKKFLKIMTLIFCASLFLTACDDNGEPTDAPEGSVVMTAVVQNVADKITVDVTESEYTSGVHLVLTSGNTEYYDENGKKVTRDAIKVGDTVVIYYSGQVMLSYPPQISAIRISIKK